jgi:chromosome segregation ATPase
MEKEKDVETLLKDLANYKVQMAAKDSAYSQLLLKLEHYQKSSEELSILLKKSEVERDVYCEDCREARTRIHELEAKVKEMTDELLETGKIREKLTHVLSELKSTEEEILGMETQLATAREVNLKALAEAELMATAANMEKKRSEELVKHVAELNEAILVSKLASIEAEKEKCMVLSDKDARLESAMEMAAQAQEQVEDMKKRLEIMQELENQLLAKSVLVDSLQAELNQASELLSSSNKTVSDAVKDLNQLNADLIVKERDNSDHTFYFGALETELNQLEAELKNENEEASHLSRNMEILMDELQEAKTKIYEIKEREKEAQIEIAVLKSELHKGRSELSAAEARTGSVKPGLYLAVQQLAVEAEAAERENQRLKGLDRVTEESEDFGLMHTDQHEKYSCQDVDAFQKNESNAESVKRRNENDGNITISLEEYEFLIRKAEKAGEFLRRESSNMSITSITSENKYESQLLKKELEIAIVKNRELRTRLEQAVTRAEAAEKAKTILEDQQKRRQEQKQRIKAAIVGLHEESTSREFSSSTYGSAPKEYQPLGKVLNMKF